MLPRNYKLFVPLNPLRTAFPSAKQTLGVVLLSIVTMPALADITSQVNLNNADAQTMITNIATQVPSLMRFLTALSYVMGIYFMYAGVLKLKAFGEARSMMSQGEAHLRGPLTYLIIGALLIYLPTSVQVGLSTFWTDPNPYGYLQEPDQWSAFINVCFSIVQLVGTIAFIRGLVILSHLSGHGQPDTFSRGMTHIIGGILCINIYQLLQVVFVTLGIAST